MRRVKLLGHMGLLTVHRPLLVYSTRGCMCKSEFHEAMTLYGVPNAYIVLITLSVLVYSTLPWQPKL